MKIKFLRMADGQLYANRDNLVAFLHDMQRAVKGPASWLAEIKHLTDQLEKAGTGKQAARDRFERRVENKTDSTACAYDVSATVNGQSFTFRLATQLTAAPSLSPLRAYRIIEALNPGGSEIKDVKVTDRTSRNK